jgi:SAM-dependent methyltransferase
MNFTAHNIRLDDGQKTMGDSSELLAETPLWTSIQKTIDLFFPEMRTQRRALRVVDLGCLEGGYAVEFARMGFDTLGIEARRENIQNCEFVKSHLVLPNLRFAQDDVRNIAAHGSFDITFCGGLLYHLDNPSAYLHTLSNCTREMLILHTHYAQQHDYRYSLGLLNRYLVAPIKQALKLRGKKKNWGLSRLTEHERQKGRWFKEYGKRETQENIETFLWSSYNNDRSFWPCKNDLIQILVDVGFDTVFERFDFVKDIANDNYIAYYDRSMFVALKSAALT